ncbi:hypothetical protein PMAYCL1PPCAC_10882 [Pristionchus mayeri]|uniref:Uncharacterized protein n=1 Tax=Pristionchus mayeri TaxID=1317129 RepID=A0AAN4ZGD4_9BILA|nr:hypothetical protein PMAYCL1PPCAC_10882 [Pristionchus mayeri]
MYVQYFARNVKLYRFFFRSQPYSGGSIVTDILNFPLLYRTFPYLLPMLTLLTIAHLMIRREELPRLHRGRQDRKRRRLHQQQHQHQQELRQHQKLAKEALQQVRHARRHQQRLRRRQQRHIQRHFWAAVAPGA